MLSLMQKVISKNFSSNSAVLRTSFDKLAAIITKIELKGPTVQAFPAQFKAFISVNKQKIKSLSQFKTDFDLINVERAKESDLNLKELFDDEIRLIQHKISEINQELSKSIFLITNENVNQVVMEIRPGTGGDEAAMFTKELSTVYENYFQYKNWNFDLLSENSDGAQSRETIYSISSESFADLQFKTGVHRVQRVPRTDSQGRIHTSTVTVAVIPQCKDYNSLLNEKDVRMDVFRSSGPGGQNVNKTNSAVRLVHIPTGITVSMQDERSQILNKVKAFKVLEFRLQERDRSHKSQTIKTLRSEQIGTGERSDKIRTYNFQQNRITDHRSGLSTQNLPLLFEDPSVLEKIIESNKAECIDKFISDLEAIIEAVNK